MNKLQMEGFLKKIVRTLDEIEKRISRLEALQKQDADEAIGQIGDLLFITDEHDRKIAELEKASDAHDLSLFGLVNRTVSTSPVENELTLNPLFPPL